MKVLLFHSGCAVKVQDGETHTGMYRGRETSEKASPVKENGGLEEGS